MVFNTMKPLLVALCAFTLAVSGSWAGSEAFGNKDTRTIAPCPAWYADKEWNVTVWGTGVFTANDYPSLENANPNFGLSKHDDYLGADHAWGGGLSARYFFARYFGVGIEAYGLAVRQSFADAFIDFFAVGAGTNFARTSHESRTIGSVLGTFTLRYPIGCTRLAPYAFAGGGAIFGGGQVSRYHSGFDTFFTTRSGGSSEPLGQFGGGLEIRLTPHIGWTNDFSWNVVNGPDNNFGMARTGINFVF